VVTRWSPDGTRLLTKGYSHDSYGCPAANWVRCAMLRLVQDVEGPQRLCEVDPGPPLRILHQCEKCSAPTRPPPHSVERIEVFLKIAIGAYIALQDVSLEPLIALYSIG